MNFLNPIVLIGLAAAGIPVLLHLLNLRKLKTVEFSTLRFLKELQKTRIRRLKIKRLLLLLLRILVIVFAVLAFARPAIEGAIPFMESSAKTSAIILVDNSFSMDVSDEFGNRFKRSMKAANKILDGLKEGDEALILPMSGSYFKDESGFSRNKAYLKSKLAKIKINNSVADADKALRAAANLMDESFNLNKEVYIISDFQRISFQSQIDDSLDLFDEDASIYAVPIGSQSGAKIENLSIDSVNVLTRIFQRGKPVEAEVFVRNNSGKAIDAAVVSLLFDGDRVASRPIDVPPGKTASTLISAIPQTRGAVGAAAELESDALDVDNKRYFGFIIPDKPKIALVGDPGKRAFLELAFANSFDDDEGKSVESFAPARFSGVDFTDFDLVVLAGGPYKEADLSRLAKYVENGGSALIFADDQTDKKIFATSLEKMGFGKISERKFSERNPGAFTSVDKLHPIFDGVFKGSTDKREIVETPAIYRAMPATAGQPVVEMPGGAFLAESRIDAGKILYCAVPPDGDWSGFPFTGLFPAFAYRAAAFLSAREDFSDFVETNSSHMLNVPKTFAAAGNFKIVDPNGAEYFKRAARLPTGAVLSFESLETPGVYSVYNLNGKPVSLLAVNPPAKESILQRYKSGEIVSNVAEISGAKAKIAVIDESENISESVNRARMGAELWRFFLIAALICAVAEMIVARTGEEKSPNS